VWKGWCNPHRGKLLFPSYIFYDFVFIYQQAEGSQAGDGGTRRGCGHPLKYLHMIQGYLLFFSTLFFTLKNKLYFAIVLLFNITYQHTFAA